MVESTIDMSQRRGFGPLARELVLSNGPKPPNFSSFPSDFTEKQNILENPKISLDFTTGFSMFSGEMTGEAPEKTSLLNGSRPQDPEPPDLQDPDEACRYASHCSSRKAWQRELNEHWYRYTIQNIYIYIHIWYIDIHIHMIQMYTLYVEFIIYIAHIVYLHDI